MESPLPSKPASAKAKPVAIVAVLVVMGVFALIAGTYLAVTSEIKNSRRGRGGQSQVPSGAQVPLAEKLAEQSKVKKFKTYEEVNAFLEKNVGQEDLGYNPGFGFKSWATDSIVGLSEERVMPSASLGMGGGSNDYSRTNIQVAGVDEADIVKTDGKYAYAVVGQEVMIIDAFPAQTARIVGKIALSANPTEMYVKGDKLVVFGYDTALEATDLFKSFKRKGGFSFFRVYDIKNKENPVLATNLSFEGYYSDSRMIGEYVYFITSTPAQYYDGELPVPKILRDGALLSNAPGTPYCNCPDIYYFDIPNSRYNFLNVSAINVANPSEQVANQVYLMAANQNMYVSADNIYITYTKHLDEQEVMTQVLREIVFGRLSSRDKERIAAIESAENYVLSPREKLAKIAFILERYRESLPDYEQQALQEMIKQRTREKYDDIAKELEKTVIHKIAIKKNSLEYKAMGEVPGSVLNQFSMDENDGLFRIATNKGRAWSGLIEDTEREAYNNLYVLDENLHTVGSLEHLAPNESIHSVRFMQDRAYMVTFEQVDPLFVIDLKDPRHPSVLGKLKIPGYSDYLHPYDDNLLIGVGKETEVNEHGGVTTRGVKLSLFDVSDVSNPRQIAKQELGGAGSTSIVLDDHKAFLFSRDKHLLVLPVSLTKIDQTAEIDEWQPPVVSSAAVFRIDENGFEYRTLIRHFDSDPADGSIDDMAYSYDAAVQRSFYIENVLYTFSNRRLQANNLDDLEQLKQVNFGSVERPINPGPYDMFLPE